MGMGPHYQINFSQEEIEMIERDRVARQKVRDEKKRKENSLALRKKPVPVKREQRV